MLSSVVVHAVAVGAIQGANSKFHTVSWHQFAYNWPLIMLNLYAKFLLKDTLTMIMIMTLIPCLSIKKSLLLLCQTIKLAILIRLFAAASASFNDHHFWAPFNALISSIINFRRRRRRLHDKTLVFSLNKWQQIIYRQQSFQMDINEHQSKLIQLDQPQLN